MSARSRAGAGRIRAGFSGESKYSDYKRGDPERFFGVQHAFGIFATISFISYAVYVSNTFLPKSKPVHAPVREFSGDRARKHLITITKIGSRPSGSYENDIIAVETILKVLERIKAKGNSKLFVEIELQYSSGSFGIIRKNNFIDLGITSTYGNITNILVKIQGKKDEDKFILVNAHYDTVPNTVGASDDTVSCAVLIEAFRALSVVEPNELKHGVVFLINGAEEGGLAGSHAFVKEHRWASLIKAFVNVEAAGSGGREFVFQTGPENPWILHSYASAAKYPFASVVAQEVFQSGVIPSDTDYRVFVQYGSYVGIDLAFISNGYVYHTKYDNAEGIPSGSIQRAGDNVFNLIKSLVNSPYLEEPAEYKHGSLVFFDILGTFVVHYPKRLGILLNNLTSFAVIIYIIQRLVRKKFSSMKEHVGLRTSLEHFTVSSLILAALTILLSYTFGLMCSLGAAYTLMKMNYMMVWYSRPLFCIFLYGLPTLFGMLSVHYIGHLVMKRVTYPSIASFIYAHLLISAVVLAIINRFQICSSFLLWIWVIFPFLLLCVPNDVITFLPEMRTNGVFALHLLGCLLPLVVTVYHVNVLFSFFGPLLGRTGTEIPPDLVMAVFTSFCISLIFTYFMNLYHGAFNMRRFLVIMGVVSVLPLLWSLRGANPYSVKDGLITPKRMFIQHTLRRFNNANGTIRKEDSGLWMQPLDYNGVKEISHVAFFKDLKPLECEGSYCGLPYYYAMRKIIRKQWFLFGEKPEVVGNPFTKDIYKREVTEDGYIRFYFDIEGPDHMMLYLTVRRNAELIDWSMYKTEDNHILSMDDHVGKGDRVHYVFYSHGYYAEKWRFWVEFKTSVKDSELAEIGISRLYVSGEKSRSQFLRSAIKALPEYVCDNSWTSNYDSFVLS